MAEATLRVGEFRDEAWIKLEYGDGGWAPEQDDYVRLLL